VVLTIAAHASLLILGLDRGVYRDVRAIVVHGGTVVQHGPRATTIPGVVADGPRRLLGLAGAHRSPVVLSWPVVRDGIRHPERGRNVVVHGGTGHQP
jgi:hypothetical protein